MTALLVVSISLRRKPFCLFFAIAFRFCPESSPRSGCDGDEELREKTQKKALATRANQDFGGFGILGKMKGDFTMKQNVADIITQVIIDKLESGIIPWRKPWNAVAQTPCNMVSKKAYRGVNYFLLANYDFSSPYFMTFMQIQAKGGQVKAGSRGFPVVFWSIMEIEDKETGTEKNMPIMRYYKVFNVEQTTIEVPALPQVEREFSPIAEAEGIVAAMPLRPEIRHREAKAYYSPGFDFVNMPKKELFKSDEEYYSTLYHELGHSTGHHSRLARKSITEANFFGSHEYSKEELVAEMSAAFLCAEAGISPTTIDNSAAYISGWLRALKSKDNRAMVIQAASQAQKAADYILNHHLEETKAAA
jgi:antirestriction protein ArdC